MGRNAVRVVAIEVPEQALMARLGGRRSCPKDGASYHVEFNPPKREGTCDVCGGPLVLREDDRPEAITKRLEEYRKKTAPLTQYYRGRNVLREVDGLGEPEEIRERIIRSLE
jgi:adenylate kinase